MARSYAKALFELAAQSHQLEAWQNFLSKAALIAKDKHVRKLWLNPKMTSGKISDLFEKICGELPQGANRLIELLVDKKRLDALPQIADLFAELVSSRANQSDVIVTTALPADESLQKRIKAVLVQYFKQDLAFHFQVDKNILGGFVARVRHRVVDASIAHTLKMMEQRII